MVEVRPQKHEGSQGRHDAKTFSGATPFRPEPFQEAFVQMIRKQVVGSLQSTSTSVTKYFLAPLPPNISILLTSAKRSSTRSAKQLTEDIPRAYG